MGGAYSVGPYICLFTVPVATQKTGHQWTDNELGEFNICPSDTTRSLRCCYGFSRDHHGSCTVCPPGTFGEDCKSLCPRGTYGTQCKLKCGDKCSECHSIYGCQVVENRTYLPEERYILSFHKHEYPTSWPVSAMIAVTALSTCLLMCLIIQASVCCRKGIKKIRSSRSNDSTNMTKNKQYYGLKPNTGQSHMYAEQYNDIEDSNNPTTKITTGTGEPKIANRKYDYVDDHPVRKPESSTERKNSENGRKYYDIDENIRSKNKSPIKDPQYSLVKPATSLQSFRNSCNQYIGGNGTEDYLDPVVTESTLHHF